MRPSIIWLIAAAAVGAAASAAAQPVPAALQACTRLTQDNERLACFDREIAALSAGAGSGTHPAAAGAAAATPAAASGSPVASASSAIPAASAPGAPVAPSPSGTASASRAAAPAATGTSAAGAAAAGAVAAGAVAASTATATPATASPAATGPAAASPAVAAGGTAAPGPAAARPAGAAGGTAAAAQSPASLTPEDRVGLSAEAVRKLEAERGIKSADVKPPKEFTAHIASVSRNAAGRAVVTLDNGQVWRQSETRASFEAHAGDAVTVSSGAIGSFWLATDVHNRTRVERIH